ncbi:hypothetical protein HN51_061722 [Arachis hypogaea]
MFSENFRCVLSFPTLTKSLLPLPDKYDRITDIDKRYVQRKSILSPVLKELKSTGEDKNMERAQAGKRNTLYYNSSFSFSDSYMVSAFIIYDGRGRMLSL